MQPDISFAHTSDGVSIAYWTLGDGPPLVVMPTFVSDVAADWNTPRRLLYERLARHFRVIRYDARGQGLSERKIEAISLGTGCADLEAVMDAAGVEQANILAQLIATPAAVTFGVTKPDRVTNLILWHPVACVAQYFEQPPWPAMSSVASEDWDLFAQVVAYCRVGWARPEAAGQMAEVLRRSMDVDFFRLLRREEKALDASDQLSKVTIPTLVLHLRSYEGLDASISLSIASQIPTARYHLIDDVGERETNKGSVEVLREIERFVGVPTANGSAPVATDVADLSAREVTIVALIGSGRTNKEIASYLGISVHTVERHVATIYSKIGGHSRGAVVTYAIQNGLMMGDAIRGEL